MEALYWGSSSMDLQLTIFLLIVSLIISVAIFAFTRMARVSLLVFSLLSNAIFLLGAFTHSEMFRAYGLVWLEFFSVFIWPVLNIIFIIWYVRTGAKAKPKK
jgi:hypothetical protein